ncbi:ABC transporter ATP-binding protein [Bacillus suaedaesalsae]|uniref:ABC transporter ATP-binding protein n=1 Tax=Bacillus suaedaesalsae TaxID=2810349 RepID=A0ABS2DDD0_9BACI|nr:ABC transporter ATP-binding protein [Bacillus suaedaesalsae]MBM6616441.1 ABC transporter ATP-binding protein [Bacillus suaedaesalsae]
MYTESIVLNVQEVSKSIGKTPIIHNVSFDLKRGEILGLLGPNGSGKTTILKMLVGLLKPSAGTIKVEGKDIQLSFEKAIRHIGAIIENPELYDYLSGYDNLVHFLQMSESINYERIEEVTKLLRMEDYLQSKVRTYSLGMKQRLGLAQAMLHHPSILLLDEPTNGLDPEGMMELRQLLVKLAKEQGVAVIISSHQLAEIELICDSIVVIQDGSIIEKSNLREEGDSESNVGSYTFKILNIKTVTSIIEGFALPNLVLNEEGFQVDLTEMGVSELNKRLIKHEIDVVGIKRTENTLEDRFLKTLKGRSK